MDVSAFMESLFPTIIPVIFPLIIPVTTWVIVKYISNKVLKSVVDTKEDFRAMKEAIKDLIGDRITQAHGFFMERGNISKHSFASLEDMFRQYEKLGGNGFICHLMEEIRELPKFNSDYKN